MKKIVKTLSIIMLIAFSSAFISCSNDSEMTNNDTNAKSSAADLNKQSGGTAPVVNSGPGGTSHKLILTNNTSTALLIQYLYASDGPSSGFIIVNKVAPAVGITLPPMSTVSYTDVVNAVPASYNIANWATSAGNYSAQYVLSTYGIQIPNAVLGAKYTYWTGVDITQLSGGGHIIGRTNPSSFTAYTGATISWTVQTNGDCVVTAN